MKRLLTIFGDFILILVAVSCVIGALISAFAFTVDAVLMTATWAVAAFALSLHASLWRKKGLLILLLPFLALCLWKLQEILEGAKWVIFEITTEFSKWLYVPVLFPHEEPSTLAPTLFFTFAGIVVAFLLSVAICLRRSVFLTILFTAPIVFLTFVIVFNQAEQIFLLGLLAVYLTVLFSSGFFPDDFKKRGVAALPALGLAVLFMGSAFMLAPPDRYNREDNLRDIDNQIRHFASRVGIARIKSGVGWPYMSRDTWGFDTGRVEISEAGSRVIGDHSLLEVTATNAGVFYLRGYSMQRFENGRWTVNSELLPLQDDALARAAPALMAHAFYRTYSDIEPTLVNMVIDRTGDRTVGAVYTPYYSFPFRWNVSPYFFDFLHIEDSILSLHAAIPPENLPLIDLSGFSEQVQRSDAYLQVESSTAEGLRRIAADVGIDADADRAVISDQVSEFLTTFGRYTLSPFVIPEGEDFALYFLRTSRQGYCIHYATTATLMLRSLGVPARFTSGFVVRVDRADVGRTLVVTDRNAHAWVEVYYDDVGWLPLEVTPPAVGFGISDGRPHAGDGSMFPHADFDDFEDEFFHDWMQDLYANGMPDDLGLGGAGYGGEQPGLSGAARTIITCVFIAASFSALLLRGSFSRRNRESRFSQEDTNASVLFAWRYLSRLMKWRRRESPPVELEDIALKARFSQHLLSEDERSAVIAYAREFAAKVYRTRTWAGQFWIKCVLGL